MRDYTAQHQREQLHRAARDGDLKQVEKLLAAKYPLNRFDDTGRTPLHCAVERGHLHIVERLLEAGAHVDAADERQIGNTPLCDNIDRCSFHMAKFLLDAGADPTVPGWMGKSAVDRVAAREDVDADKVRRIVEEAAVRRR